jgi:hypothetical protein
MTQPPTSDPTRDETPLHPDAEDTLAEIPDFAAPELIPPFESVRWARAAGAAPWLQEAVTRLAAVHASIPSAASGGLLARLWTLPEDIRIAQEDLPRVRVRDHVRAASNAQRSHLEAHAVARA